MKGVNKMAVLTREDYLARIRERIGEDTSDTAIKFLEDMTDTYDSLKPQSEKDWEKEYKNLDEQWRRKYMERFYGNGESNETVIKVQEIINTTPTPPDTTQPPDPTDITIDELLEGDIVVKED